ncbi:MAG TPA: hypothetical protein VGL23_06860, partial [Chloroflexota bacterium]
TEVDTRWASDLDSDRPGSARADDPGAEAANRALDILERDKKSRRRMYETLGIPLDDTVL